MHQKTPYKFNAGNGQFLPLSFFPVILNRKSNIFIIHMDDAVIADSDPMGILSKVVNHRSCAVLWSSIFVTLMANKIGGLQFGIYRNCQISSRVFHTAVAALPLTKANRSDFE